MCVSEMAARGLRPLRNAQLTSVAPTGTISVLAGTTAGIEPMFAIPCIRRTLGRELIETNRSFERLARERGFCGPDLFDELARTGGLRDNEAVPEDVRRAFVSAHEIDPEWHLRMQAAFQRHTDAAVAKTVNLPAGAQIEDVVQIFTEAWRLDAKGITVYRKRSKRDRAGGCGGHACEF